MPPADEEPEGDVDAAMSAELRFGEATAIISASMVAPFEAWLDVEGEHGSLRVDNPIVPHRGHLLTVRTDSGAASDETVDGPTSWGAQLVAICNTLLDGRPFPASRDDPLRSMRAIDRIRDK